MASSKIDTVLNIYKSIAKLPVLSAARISSIQRGGITIQSTWSQRNLVKRTKHKFNQDISLDAEFVPIVESFPVDISSEIASCTTDDDSLRAIFRQTTVDNAQKIFIEIWDRTGMIKCYDLSVYDVHGEIYTDVEFSSFQWSPDRTKVIYVAEKKGPKTEPFYKQKTAEKLAKEETEGEKISRGTEYVYKPHWGEQLIGKHRSVIVVLNIEDDTIKTNDFVPDEYFVGQILFTPNGEYIVGVCWKREKRYFGLYACTNRPSWVFLLKNTEFKIISPDGFSVRSPRFSPDGKILIYYQRTLSTPHHNAHRLRSIKWETDEQINSTIEITNDVQVIAGDKKFYGLYARNLPLRCWSIDSKYVFLSTPQRNVIKSYIVNIETSVITEIQSDGSSLLVLEVRKNRILFLKTSLTRPSQLVMGKFDPTATDLGNLHLQNITNPIPIPGLDELTYEHNEYEYETNEEVKNFNFTYFGKKGGEDKSTPLIVVPHGGPHSCFDNTFSIGQATYALLGYAIIQVNYRGSAGMGAKNVEYLQGKVGEIDVLDCVTATKEALKKYPWLDPDRVCVMGGSHGGFLTAHLTGNYPDLYKVAVLMNPVIDIPSMLVMTDIPDWCAAVTGCEFLESLPPTVKETKYAEILLKMYNHSPILYVDKVKAPSLVCLGSKDFRVPYYQGKLWYNRLVVNKVPTKMLLYEDNHSLASDLTEMDVIINIALWLLEHTPERVEPPPEIEVTPEPTEEAPAEPAPETEPAPAPTPAKSPVPAKTPGPGKAKGK